MMIASKFDGDDHDDLNLIVSHVGRMPCVDFDRFAQVGDRIASHVQRDLMMTAMMLLMMMRIKMMLLMMQMKL